MAWFSNNKNKEETMENEKSKAGVIIHFTPAAIFVYTCDEYLEGFEGTITFKNSLGNRSEIGGTFISIEVEDEYPTSKIIKEYKLDTMNLPIIEMNAYNYDFE
ncbi:hypothetical protein [Bacillus toyonensis]|uniref:hypothetical protein n=1 Tax=Bacillus toyonensis TaxID=155322 RepID=UPI002E1F76BB|nr:hypothetical protein [Bacillus toyonensis]